MVGQQHTQEAQTGLSLQASIKNVGQYALWHTYGFWWNKQNL